MNIRQIISSLFVLASFDLLWFRGDWQSVAGLFVLAGFLVLSDKKSEAKSSDDAELKNQIKDLQNKVQGLLLAKGMGR